VCDFNTVTAVTPLGGYTQTLHELLDTFRNQEIGVTDVTRLKLLKKKALQGGVTEALQALQKERTAGALAAALTRRRSVKVQHGNKIERGPDGTWLSSGNPRGSAFVRYWTKADKVEFWPGTACPLMMLWTAPALRHQECHRVVA
jgi:hypothetical protein